MPVSVMSLAAFNAAAEDDARRLLAECCTSAAWTADVLAGRPFPDRAALLARNEAAVAGLDDDALAEALAGHPRIGERPSAQAHSVEHSRREQAGMADADDDVRRAIAAGNHAYEERFGHVYLVCATGRSARDLLDVLTTRLTHDAQTEAAVVRAELARINAIRLERLVADRDGTGS